ncbi:MAG: PRC-barrel domain-containing protein [Longimicrobiales bacterium]
MAGQDDRAGRDRAGVGPDPDYVTGDLVRMRDLKNFAFSRGEPDIRGWEVCTLTGHHIGDVNEVLVDARRGQVVLLDVDFVDQSGRAEVPVRAVQLDRARHRVIVDSGELSRFRAQPMDEAARRAEILDRVERDLIDDDDRVR